MLSVGILTNKNRRDDKEGWGGWLEERREGKTRRGKRQRRKYGAPGKDVRAIACSAPQSLGIQKETIECLGRACAWQAWGRVLWGSDPGEQRKKEHKILNNVYLLLENYGQLLPTAVLPVVLCNSWKYPLCVNFIFVFVCQMGLVIFLSSECTSCNCYYFYCDACPWGLTRKAEPTRKGMKLIFTSNNYIIIVSLYFCTKLTVCMIWKREAHPIFSGRKVTLGGIF